MQRVGVLKMRVAGSGHLSPDLKALGRLEPNIAYKDRLLSRILEGFCLKPCAQGPQIQFPIQSVATTKAEAAKTSDSPQSLELATAIDAVPIEDNIVAAVIDITFMLSNAVPIEIFSMAPI